MTNPVCVQRLNNGKVKYCPDYKECSAQVFSGGPAMCEIMLPGEDVGEPQLLFTPSRIKVRDDDFKKLPWPKRRDALLELIWRVTWAGQGLTYKQIAVETGGSYTSAVKWVSRLQDENAVTVESGGGAGNPSLIYGYSPVQ